jgi:hypothetical protein
MTEDLELRIGKLELRTGDILVLKTSAKLSPERLEVIASTFRELIPLNIRTVVLDGDDWQIAVLR